ncbi:MAG: DnaB-like helicase C-terminal domain-containing protein, partial [Ignavibacteriales bacterium]
KGLDFAVGLQEHIMQTMTKYIDGCIREIRNAETGDEVMQEIRKTMEGVSDEYIRTGITSLDRQVIGIPKRHLTVIAGRPGMGKTAFMLQIARNIMDQGYKVGIFSLEMEVQSLWVRNLSEATDIDSLRIEDGKLNAEEYVRLKAASEKYRRDNYIIDDSPSQTPEQIKARINLWKTRGKADVIMIDYLTLINTNYNKERYDLEIGSLARDLRIFAKKTCTPIIILSQLNREPERRQNRKPQLSDLRESGTIEQEAKLVLLLHRPWVYGIDPYEGSRFSHYTKGGERLKPEEYMEVIIAKARNGRIGFAPVRYIPEVHRIEAVTTREHGNGAF